MLFLVLNTALSLTTLVVLLWIVHEYIRARREIGKLSSLLNTKTLRKQKDDLLEGLLAEETTVVQPAAAAAEQPQPTTAAQRERLATIVAGGRPDSTLGRPGPWKKSMHWATTRLESSTPATRHDWGLP